MIKFINSGEISKLKKGFYRTLAVKKIINLDYDKFKNMSFNLKTAILIFKSIVLGNFSSIYKDASSIMLEYLLKYNVLRKPEYDKVVEFFTDDSFEEVDMDYYYDYMDNREALISLFLQEAAEKNNLILHQETTKTIFIGDDINRNIFGEYQRDLRNATSFYYLEDTSAERLHDIYMDNFNGESIIYALENCILNFNQLELLNYCLDDCCSDIPAEVYVENGNTYFSIPFQYLLERVGFTFPIILKLVLMEI